MGFDFLFESCIAFCADLSHFTMFLSQCPEVNLNKISNSIHKTYIGLTSMLQGFQKYNA